MQPEAYLQRFSSRQYALWQQGDLPLYLQRRDDRLPGMLLLGHRGAKHGQEAFVGYGLQHATVLWHNALYDLI
jgi:hypothetical protein